MPITTINEHTFFKRFVNQNSIVLDLGANQGKFALEMIKSFGCQLFAIEANFEIMSKIPPHPRLRTFDLAVTKTTGPISFYIAENSECSSLHLNNEEPPTKTVTIEGLSLEDLVKKLSLQRLDLVKMDIEGAEIEVLDSCSDSFLQSISQLTIEFHDFNGLVPREEVERILKRLRSLGFFVLSMAKSSYFDVCLINRQRCSVGIFEYAWVSLILRNYHGIKRVLQRTFSP